MKTENIIIGNLKKIDAVKEYDIEEQYKIKDQIEPKNHNVHYMVIHHGYSVSDVSDKAYYLRIPFGKYKGKYIDFKNIDTVIDLIKAYFSLVGVDKIPVYCNLDDKQQEYEDGMCKVGDLYLGSIEPVYYYEQGSVWPDKNIPFSKVKQLTKKGQINDHIYGKK